MKRFLILSLALAVLLLAGCLPAVDSGPSGPRVYNSAWQDMTPDLADRGVRAGEALTLDEYIAAYNAAHTDDQLILMEGETPIEEAPDAVAYIVNTATLEIYWTDTVQRADLVERRDAWRTTLEIYPNPDGSGAWVPVTLYVDNIPPEPPYIPPVLPKLWIALYNETTMLYYWSEHYELEVSARGRYLNMEAQASLNNADPSIMGPGVWRPYWGAVEFAQEGYSPGVYPAP